ncbi:MAG TPA: ImmA/IrrE family metallo-endopeptidase [Candidatus Acidoferrales bacterium]|nr:ImmA/IrrE family metallo-endopeptidase [Candidatus Acidoferrales bacterium]
MEAIKLQMESKVHSIEDISILASRAGYVLHFTDLPANVGGLAIENTPYIAVNRAKPRHHQAYTIAHELGHQVLHLTPSQESHSLSGEGKGLGEFQANMFASILTFGVANEADREAIIRQNPESMLVPVAATLISISFLAVALIFYVCFRLRPAQSDKLAGRE